MFIYKSIFAVGLYQIGSHTYRCLKSIYDLKLDDNHRMQHQFGKGEWALITGASEGIGE